MKEFILTMGYSSIEAMVNSDEVAIYKEELKNSSDEAYAIVSRMGNRYDFDGNRITDFAPNPFIKTQDLIIEIEEVDNMKYSEIEKMIDAEVEKAVAELKAQHEAEITAIIDKHNTELDEARATAKAEAKAEILAILNS